MFLERKFSMALNPTRLFNKLYALILSKIELSSQLFLPVYKAQFFQFISIKLSACVSLNLVGFHVF